MSDLEGKKLGKTSLIKQRYDENPFASETGFRVPVRRKTERIETRGPASIVSGDERISLAEIRSIKTVDSDPFVKVFVNELDRFFGLTPTAMRITTVMLQDIGKIRMGDGDLVYLNEQSLGESMHSHGMKPPSSATYYRAIEELIQKGFIAPSTRMGLFFINPAIFFNGDRVQFVSEIRRKRQSKREALEAAGQQSLELDPDDPDQELKKLLDGE